MELAIIAVLVIATAYFLGRELLRWTCFFGALVGLFFIVNPIALSRLEGLALLAVSVAVLAIADRGATLVRTE
jgi:drug/metabolite transporter (DMT)-like permease